MAMITRAVAVLVAVILLAGCSGSMAFKRGEKFAVEGDWDRAVIEYRQALRDDPENVGFKTRLTKAVDMAATMHIERANHYMRERNSAAAQYEAEQALIYSPANNKAAQVVDAARKLGEVDRRMAAAKDYLAAGRPNDALNQYYKVLDIEPENKDAAAQIEKVTKRKVESETNQDELTLASDQPITLSFKDAKLKDVFEFLAKLSGVSIVFDEDVKNQTVTVFAKNVSFNQALGLMLATNKLFMKKVADDAIIIIPKTKSKMDQYEDLMMKTFYLSNTKAKDMVNILRTMLETRKIIINESLNSITLREAPDKILLAEKLIEANDMKDAEVVIDVEVLAVDKSDTLKYGINLPKSVTGTYFPDGGPAVVTSAIIAAGATSNITDFKSGFSNYKDNIWFSYPSVTADWSKIKGNAETLTNPQIRSLNNQPAKILIGSRVPIQTGTSVGTTTTTTFEYREVGIRLNVEPDISLANDITLKTTLEVSSLGESITVGDTGGSQPTINTTTVEATLNLRDGETVIIGGLLENISNESINGVAGLTEVPILGRIFSTNTIGPNRKRELIMTLTPHIVRSIEMPRREVTEFWSGTEEAYGNKPLFTIEKKKYDSGAVDTVAETEVPEVSMTPQPVAAQPRPQPKPAVAKPAVTPEKQPETTPEKQPEVTPETTPETTPVTKPEAVPEKQPLPPAETSQDIRPQPVQSRRVGRIGFAPEVMPLEVGQEVTIDVVVTDAEGLFEAPLSIIYNPKLVEFVKADEGNMLNSDGAPTSFMAAANDKVGYIDVMTTRLGRVPGINGSGTLFTMTFVGRSPGISPLVFKMSNLKDAAGNSVPADLKTGTLYVK